MDASRWTRDAGKVTSALVSQADGAVLTKRPLKIYIPERYTEKQLAEIGSDVFTVGIFAMVVDDTHYSVCKVNAMMRLKPTTIASVKFDGESYLEFSFDPGSVVIATKDLLKDDTLVYYVFNYFLSNGKVPWFLGYEDMATLFDTADNHAGVGLERSHSILEMFVAATSRNPQKRTQYWRHALDNGNTYDYPTPDFIAMRNITLGATNTATRLMGSYWSDGLTSALANPSTKLERVEQLLRS